MVGNLSHKPSVSLLNLDTFFLGTRLAAYNSDGLAWGIQNQILQELLKLR